MDLEECLAETSIGETHITSKFYSCFYLVNEKFLIKIRQTLAIFPFLAIYAINFEQNLNFWIEVDVTLS